MNIAPISDIGYLIIDNHRDEEFSWYIDAEGENGWMSGNAMPQGECRYGGFYSYEEAKKIFDSFEKVARYTPSQIRKYHSEGKTVFAPVVIYLGYSPLDPDDSNVFVEARTVKMPHRRIQ